MKSLRLSILVRVFKSRQNMFSLKIITGKYILYKKETKPKETFPLTL